MKCLILGIFLLLLFSPLVLADNSTDIDLIGEESQGLLGDIFDWIQENPVFWVFAIFLFVILNKKGKK